MPDRGDGTGPYYLKLETGPVPPRVPDGWYVVISFGHGVCGVLIDEQAGEIRIPFQGKYSALRAWDGIDVRVEHRGTMVEGEVINDG